MSLVVTMGLLAECEVVAKQGLRCFDVCEIESRRREGTGAVKGVGDRTATEELHHRTTSPGCDLHIRGRTGNGHSSPPSVIFIYFHPASGKPHNVSPKK